MRVVLRFRRSRTRMGGWLGGSLVAHVVGAGIIVLLPMLRPKPDLNAAPPMIVELAAPGAVASAPPSRTRAPEPPRVVPPPIPEGPHVVDRIPPPAKPKKEEKKKEDKRKEPEHPEPPKAPATSGPQGPAGAPGIAPSGAAGATGISSLPTGDPDLAGYNATISGMLDSYWTKPVLEEGTPASSVIVSFEIGRDGGVFNLQVEQPSGIPSLDRSALRAVTDAAPFPPPPASAGGSARQKIQFVLRP